MFERLKKWISIKKSQNARLLLLGIIAFNLLLWLISSLVTFLIDPDLNGSIIGALWNTGITWMMDPGFYDPDVSFPIKLISIFVIITSMITFSGGIIAYVANLFASIIEHSRSGKNQLYVYNHILILNWNSKALELIADYRYDDEVTDIVVLSEYDKEAIESQIRSKLYDVNRHTKLKNMNIIVREGDVYSKRDLDQACLERSKTVIILANEDNTPGSEPKNPDILSIKSLMLVANSHLSPKQTVIVEIRSPETVKIIKERISGQLGLGRQIIPILPDEMLGRLIAQTILYPSLNQVFQELFSFQGMEFYCSDKLRFDDIYHNCTHAIPVFEREGLTYLLAGDAKDIIHLREKPLTKVPKIEIDQKLCYQETTIAIFGKNNKLAYILDSLKWFEKDADTLVKVTIVPDNDPKTIKAHLEGLTKIDTILVLSDDFLDPKDYDSDVLITLLMIQETAKAHDAKIVIELLNPRHYDIARSYNIENTIISNQYISRIVTQLSKSPELYPLFMELLTYDADNSSYEIYTFKASSLIKSELPLCFDSQSELLHAVFDNSGREYMPIGYLRNDTLRIFSGDMDKSEKIIITAEDQLVVICR